MSKKQLHLLVGDNPFHGISHLSQQKARERAIKDNPSNVEYATQLVKLSLQNGADGFMFSVSETTLSILRGLDPDKKLDLYAIVPYAYEYVRFATRFGGVPSLAKKFSRQIIFSKNIFSFAPNLIGLIRADPSAFLKTYLIYEISRIKSAIVKNSNLRSVLLHEVITDMALALNLEQVLKAYIKFIKKSNVNPGFETRNFPYLVEKFTKWGINMNEITITASFNKVGFQMNPSQIECEDSLRKVSGSEIIAMSPLAAGYLKPSEAVDYVTSLPSITHMVVGVSKEKQALETFRLLTKKVR
jgi:hypothetical protein